MDKNAETVPNFLSHYNPNIIGGSLGHHLVEVCKSFVVSGALSIHNDTDY